MKKTLVVLVLGLLWASAAGAQVPGLINQEGVLVDAQGRALAGPVTLRFSLYAASIGGNPAWTEEYQNQTLVEGYYSVLLGSQVAITPSVVSANRWLALSVNGAALDPRIQLVSVPFALVANSVAGGTVNASLVQIGGVAVIDANRRWVGDPTGLTGPAGPAGLPGPAGPVGPVGPPGAAGGDGSPDTPAQVLAKLRDVDGPGSDINADLLDNLTSAAFMRTDVDTGTVGQASMRRVLSANGANAVFASANAITSVTSVNAAEPTLELHQQGVNTLHLSAYRTGPYNNPAGRNYLRVRSPFAQDSPAGLDLQGDALVTGAVLANGEAIIGGGGRGTAEFRGVRAGVSVDESRQLRLLAQDDANEGGHLHFSGAGANEDFAIDTYAGNLRFFEPAPSRDQVRTRGRYLFHSRGVTIENDLIVGGATTIRGALRHEGSVTQPRVWSNPRLDNYSWVDADTTTRSIEVVANVDNSGGEPQITLHHWGFGGPRMRFRGQDRTMYVEDPYADYVGYFRVTGMDTELQRLWVTPRFDRYTWAEADTTTRSIEVVANVDGSGGEPFITFHRWGHGGPRVRFDGPGRTFHVEDPYSDYTSYFRVDGMATEQERLWVTPRFDRYTWAGADTTTRSIEVVANVDGSGGQPVITMHHHGFGGPRLRFDGPNQTFHVEDPHGDYTNFFRVSGMSTETQRLWVTPRFDRYSWVGADTTTRSIEVVANVDGSGGEPFITMHNHGFGGPRLRFEGAGRTLHVEDPHGDYTSYFRVEGMATEHERLWVTPRFDRYSWVGADTTTRSIEVVANVDGSGGQPFITMHNHGYGGPRLRFDGPNRTFYIEDPHGDYTRALAISGMDLHLREDTVIRWSGRPVWFADHWASLPPGWSFGAGPGGVDEEHNDGFMMSVGHVPNTETTAAFLMINDNTDDSIFIGGGDSGCCGARWRGIRVWGGGNLWVSNQVSAGRGQLFGDVAEHVAVREKDAGEGDVVVIDPDSALQMRVSDTPRDSRVAGVVSGKPTLLLNDPGAGAPIALTGNVAVKVTNEGGAIRPGDLLTTSSTPGHAMRVEDPAPGTLIGKALEPFDAESGTIRVWLTLR